MTDAPAAPFERWLLAHGYQDLVNRPVEQLDLERLHEAIARHGAFAAADNDPGPPPNRRRLTSLFLIAAAALLLRLLWIK